MIGILLGSQPLEYLTEVLLLPGPLRDVFSNELVALTMTGQILPQDSLNELLLLILLGLPPELLRQIVLALYLGALASDCLRQMITYASAHFHVVEKTGGILLVGLLGGLVLRTGEGSDCLVTDEVAIAGILCQERLLLLPAKRHIRQFSLLLKLELAVFGFTTIGLNNVVDVVDLRMVHLVVRLCLLDALADLPGCSAITTDANSVVVPVSRLSLHFILLGLAIDKA